MPGAWLQCRKYECCYLEFQAEILPVHSTGFKVQFNSAMVIRTGLLTAFIADMFDMRNPPKNISLSIVVFIFFFLGHVC